MKKIFGLLLALVVSISFAACDKKKDTTKADTTAGKVTTAGSGNTTVASTTEYQIPAYQNVDINTSLGIAVNYSKTGFITYQEAAQVELPNGYGTLSNGDLLPVWKELKNIAGSDFVDKASTADKDTNANFAKMQTNDFAGVDLLNGNVSQIVREGVKDGGKMLDLSPYFNWSDISQSKLPFYQKFLTENPTVLNSVTASDGGIYYSPYFDGMNELENMILLNNAWVRNLLDGDGTGSSNTITKAYTATEPASNSYEVQAVVGNEVKTYTKSYTNNIITTQNGDSSKVLTGSTMLSELKAYLTATYADAFTKGIYTKLSDIYCSAGAGYDADELVALMRCVKANPQLASGDNTITSVEVLFPRTGEANRHLNLVRFAQIWGVRGLESRTEFLYLDGNGILRDARAEEDFIDAINNLNSIYKEGLIVQEYTTGYNNTVKTEWRQNLLKENKGFMTYDYNGTTSAKLSEADKTDPNYGKIYDWLTDFEAVLPPMCNWDVDGDATTKNYMHFSESSRGVKSDAWGITTNVLSDEKKLTAALRLVDYLYSPEGNKLFCYGPDCFTNGTVEYKGEQIPKFTPEMMDAIKASGLDNFVYWRKYIGSTSNIGYVRELGVEYQTLNTTGVKSIEKVNKAIELGTFQIAKSSYDCKEDPFLFLLPSSFPLTATESEQISAANQVQTVFTTGSTHGFANYIKYGWGNTEKQTKTIADYKGLVQSEFIPIALANYKAAWQRILANA